MKKKTAAKVGLASLAVMLGGGTVLMNTQAYTPVHAETQSEETETARSGETVQKSVILMIGSDETSRNLTWYANVEEAGSVQWAKQSDMQDGLFPAQYSEAAATSIAANDEGFYSNQATMTGLEENTTYVYRVVNGDTISQIYTFETGDFDDGYSFILAGDPQIGAGNTETDTVGWDETLDTAIAQLDPDFLVSAGDQVNTNNNETQYTGYLNDALTYLTSATTIGNHDSGSAAYNEHFNLPNESDSLGATTAGTDYWFVYDNTLFMVINSNNRSTAEHKEFMESAIAQNPDVRWKTVVFHHSVYSTASHVNDGDIIERREELPPVMSELGIDVVLMGHDHVYTRTYMMNGTTPDDSQGVQSEVTNPEGVLYLTANSASGSKYYDIAAPEAAYSAVMDQSYRRTITDIHVTDTSYTMTTYYMDTMEVLDTFTINKTEETSDDMASEAAISALQNMVDKANALGSDDAALNAAITAAQAVLDKDAPTATEVVTALLDLSEAMQALNASESTDALRADVQATIDFINENILTNVDNVRPGKVDALEAAVEAAQTLVDDPDASADELKEANKAMTKAAQELWEIVTKAELEALIESANGYLDGNYTEESLEALQTAITAAQAVANNDDATTSEVTDAITDLANAIAALESITLDTSALAHEIELVTEMVANIDDYVPSTVEGLADKLADAQAAMNATTQEEIDAATETLREARLSARTKADKEALYAALEAFDLYSENDYTPATWAAFYDAYRNAADIYENAEATQEEVNAAVETLNTAAKALVEAPATQEPSANSQVTKKPVQSTGSVTAASDMTAAAAGLLVLGAAGLMVATRRRKA